MLGVNTPALPASLRRTNERTVISLLLRLGSASRADLAKAAGISQPTAGKITADLLKLGILQELGTAPVPEEPAEDLGAPRLGRPGQMLRLDGRTPRFVAIEIGVDRTSVSALPVAVKLEDEWSFCFKTPGTPQAWVRELKRLADQLPRQHLWGVLVSVPGIVDEERGRILFSPNLHWLEQANLNDLVQGIWELPVVLLQEIRALALGQLTADPVGGDFFLVDFGQGVGGAIVVDGKLYTQPMPLSGEFGHTPVAGNERACGCGATGCLETLVSERGLVESFALAHKQASPDWEALARHVAEQGIEPWLAQTLEATGQVVAGALNVLGLHRVIVTGLLTELPGGVIEELSRRIRQGAMWARFGQVACQSAPHRRAAGLVAAGLDRLILPAGEERAGGLPDPRRAQRRRLVGAHT